jgi:hypothetical protein
MTFAQNTFAWKIFVRMTFAHILPDLLGRHLLRDTFARKHNFPEDICPEDIFPGEISSKDIFPVLRQISPDKCILSSRQIYLWENVFRANVFARNCPPGEVYGQMYLRAKFSRTKVYRSNDLLANVSGLMSSEQMT